MSTEIASVGQICGAKARTLLMATQNRKLIAHILPFGPAIVRIVPVLWTLAIVLMCQTVTPCAYMHACSLVLA